MQELKDKKKKKKTEVNSRYFPLFLTILFENYSTLNWLTN